MMKKRIDRVKEMLQADEAALITSGPNRFYLTGFPSSAGVLVITRDEGYFLIDFRYYEKAKHTVQGMTVQLCSRQNEEIREILKRHAIRRLFSECDAASVNDHKRWAKAFSGIEISDSDRLDRLLRELRSKKTPAELSSIAAAQKMTDQTFSYILNEIRPGRTEREIALEMEFYIRRLGSEGAAFDFIVISGKNTSLPHGVPTDKPIEPGDFVTMDFGAVKDGYRSDMTRTVAVGHVSEEQERVYQTVLTAQQKALKSIRPGEKCAEIDRIAREWIDQEGYAGCFGHALGHSVGIEIHENPGFSPRSESVLEEGTVITVEPGIYLESRFGVRIEDMVAVTESGCVDLTQSEKNLILL